MKRIKHYIKQMAFPVFFCLGVFNSCNYLDVTSYFDDTLALDSVFANKYNLERYMYGVAAQLPFEGRVYRESYTPGLLASDEAVSIMSMNINHGTAFITGEVTEDNIPSHMNNWGTYYQVIRRSNTILSRMNEVKDMGLADRIYFTGYTRFIRAYAYYHILFNYGPAILMGDEILENNEEGAYYQRARATFDETVDYICEEFEQAAELLPAPDAIPTAAFGRPSAGAAYALIARLRLHQASPAFNGGTVARTYFSDWMRSTDGVHYISQQYDETKWAIAAAACKRVIDLGYYELHTVRQREDSWIVPANVSHEEFPYGAGGIDVYRSYADMFTGETVASRNPELIWGYNSPTTKDANSIYGIIRSAFEGVNLGGYNNLGIPQHVVDAYYMADGCDKNNSSTEYPYSEEYGFSQETITFSGYELRSGVHNMYLNREARFYASMGFSERLWPCNSTSDTNKRGLTITYYYGTSGGKGQMATDVNNYPMSGTTLTKWVHPDDAMLGTGSSVSEKAYPIIRYAEILISYVEAMNNLTQPHTVEMGGGSYTVSRNIEDMKFYFNQIRYRVGLPGLTDSEVANVGQMQTIIERERMIEFLSENRRYFDIRRWGKYVEIEQSMLTGMNMDAEKEGFYEVMVMNHPYVRRRIADRKTMFLPLSRAEVRKNRMADQNPGYGS